MILIEWQPASTLALSGLRAFERGAFGLGDPAPPAHIDAVLVNGLRGFAAVAHRMHHQARTARKIAAGSVKRMIG